MEFYIKALDYIIVAINVVAIAILLIGVARFVISIFSALVLPKSREPEKFSLAMHHAKKDMGNFILISLEILIAADILHTVYEPSLQDVLVLAAIVAIRTVIAFFEQGSIKSENEQLKEEIAAARAEEN